MVKFISPDETLNRQLSKFLRTNLVVTTQFVLVLLMKVGKGADKRVNC